MFLLWFAIVAVSVTVAFVFLDQRKGHDLEISIIQDQPVTFSMVGEVNKPGVYTLEANPRLNDAISAAGGLTALADISALNLAARVGDGETIHIPSIALATPAGNDLADGALININTASVVDLVELPGIGEVLATRIVEYREQFGPFTSVDHLSEVEGISPNMVEELRPLVTVSG